MSDTMVLIFFLLLFMLFFLVLKYLKAIDEVAGCVDPSESYSMPGKVSKNKKLSLLIDFKFMVSLYTRSYAKAPDATDQFISAMDRARKFLVLQYPLAIAIFLIPIISKLAT